MKRKLLKGLLISFGVIIFNMLLLMSGLHVFFTFSIKWLGYIIVGLASLGIACGYLLYIMERRKTNIKKTTKDYSNVKTKDEDLKITTDKYKRKEKNVSYELKVSNNHEITYDKTLKEERKNTFRR